jgi:hypothetical protein
MATPETTPPCDTEATSELLLLHETDLFSALEGETLANKVSELPTGKEVDVLFKATLVTLVGPVGMRSQDTIAQAITATIEIIPISLNVFFMLKTPFWLCRDKRCQETPCISVLYNKTAIISPILTNGLS